MRGPWGVHGGPRPHQSRKHESGLLEFFPSREGARGPPGGPRPYSIRKTNWIGKKRANGLRNFWKKNGWCTPGGPRPHLNRRTHKNGLGRGLRVFECISLNIRGPWPPRGPWPHSMGRTKMDKGPMRFFQEPVGGHQGVHGPGKKEDVVSINSFEIRTF